MNQRMDIEQNRQLVLYILSKEDTVYFRKEIWKIKYNIKIEYFNFRYRIYHRKKNDFYAFELTIKEPLGVYEYIKSKSE